MKTRLLLSIFLIIPLQAHSETHNHKAHVHGAAKLTLAIEDDGKHASIALDCAGDSIMGFEHVAKSPQDKKSQDDAFRKLREQAAIVIRFDSSLKCVIRSTQVEIEKEEKSDQAVGAAPHGEHSDVNANYSVQCDSPISGSKVQVGLIGLFPKIKKVSLQILTTAKQTANEVTDERSSIEIP